MKRRCLKTGSSFAVVSAFGLGLGAGPGRGRGPGPDQDQDHGQIAIRNDQIYAEGSISGVHFWPYISLVL